MPNITQRKNKAGEVVSYRIRVARGYDSEGNKLKPYEKTWKPSPGMTAKQAEKEAQRQALLFEEQCKTGLSGDASRITLAEFVPVYLEQAKLLLSPTTYQNYKKELDIKILPALGHIKLADLKPIHIQAFVNQLTAFKKADGSQISASTVQRVYAILCAVVKCALKQGLLTQNPTSKDRVTLPRVPVPEVGIFTKQEAAAMLEALEQEPLQFQVLIQLAIMTGARRGELVALRFDDFDKTSNKVTISRTFIKVAGQSAQLKPPKTGKSRSVTVPSACIALVEQLEQEKKMQRQALGNYWKEGGWLFTQDNGEAMNVQTPTKQFAKFLKKNGFQHRKFHALRHTSATLLLYGGTNIRQVQERLGHGSLATTNKYLHCLAEADEEAANVLQNMLITHDKAEQVAITQQATG